MPPESGVYSITCVPTGKVYIGSTKNFSSRWKAHRSLLASGKHHNRYLQRAWDKYGADTFTFSVLETCPKTALFEREQARYETIPTKLRFNLSFIWPCVEPLLPRPHPSLVTRLRMSMAKLAESRTGDTWKQWREKTQARIDREVKRMERLALCKARRELRRKPKPRIRKKTKAIRKRMSRINEFAFFWLQPADFIALCAFTVRNQTFPQLLQKYFSAR